MKNTTNHREMIDAPNADFGSISANEKLARLVVRYGSRGLFLSVLLAWVTVSVNAQTIWFSGQRAFGQATVEPGDSTSRRP